MNEKNYVYGKWVYGKNVSFQVTGATLPSEEEVQEKLDGWVLKYTELEPSFIYLRDAYEDGNVGVARIFPDGECWFEDETEPDYEDIRPIEIEDSNHNNVWVVDVAGTGVRPILYIESEETLPMKKGEIVHIGDEGLVYISSNMLLLDHSLFDGESRSYGIFDEETNIYEDSLAKERVDAWFETNIKPFLS